MTNDELEIYIQFIAMCAGVVFLDTAVKNLVIVIKYWILGKRDG